MGLFNGNDGLELLGKATKFERGNVPKNFGLDKGKDDRSTPGVNLINAMKYSDLSMTIMMTTQTWARNVCPQ